MRLPSLEAAWTDARAAFVRFPLVIASGAAAAGIGMWLMDAGSDDVAWRLVGTAILGLPAFFALKLWSERIEMGASRLWMVRLGVLALLALFAWGSMGWSDSLGRIRFLHAALALHLLAAVLPAWGLDGLTGFWQYNRILLLRFLTAGFFSAVMFVGLSVALLACNRLLGLPLDDDIVLRLWLLMAFVFHPWFFLGGVPRDLAALDGSKDYPTGLKVFSQFVLVPLVTVYLLILTAYLGRVVFTWTWPSGWIGWLVSSVAIVGVLALLLVHPIRDREENWWVDTYGRWFFVVLLPSLAMLLIAIVQRVEQYGITEKRYVMIALSLWLTAVALFYGFTGSRDIRVIPLTLLLLALATFAGPLSVYTVSERSQLNRLEALLESNGMIQDGEARAATGDVSPEDAREISAVLRYFEETRGLRAAEPVLGRNVVAAATNGIEKPVARYGGDSQAAAVAKHLDLVYVDRWQNVSGDYINVYVNNPQGHIEISGFDYMIQGYYGQEMTTALGSDSIRIVPSSPQRTLRVFLNNQPLATIDLGPLMTYVTAHPEAVTGSLQLQPDQTQIEASGGEGRVRLMLDALTLNREDGQWNLQSSSGRLLIDRTAPPDA